MKVKTVEGREVDISEAEARKVYEKVNFKKCEEVVLYELERYGIRLKPHEVKDTIEVFKDMLLDDSWSRVKEALYYLDLKMEVDFRENVKYADNYEC